MKEYSVIGKSIPRVDGRVKVTGEAKFTADMRLDRMLYGKILRSPYSHAKILNIDISRALRLRGVKAIITGRDTLGIKYNFLDLPQSNDEHILAINKVRFIGDEIAAVAAIDEDIAEEALELIKVDYYILPAVFDPEEAMKEGAPKIHDHVEDNISWHFTIKEGDVEKGFEESHHIREDRFKTQPQNHAFLEPHEALANFESSGKLTLWTSTQSVPWVRRGLSKTLGIPESNIRVIKPHTGGGFGGKIEMFSHQACAALLSMKSGCPVKISLTREEVFIAGRQRHAFNIELKTGVKKDGTLMATKARIIADGGAYNAIGIISIYLIGMFLNSPYRIPNIEAEGFRVYTNKPPCSAMKGHGVLQKHFSFESHMDLIAEDVGIAPFELRIKNALKSGDITPSQWRVGSSGFTECLNRVYQAVNWEEKRGKLPEGYGIGVGAGSCLAGANMDPAQAATAVININPDGGVTILTGAADIGQGIETVLCQIVAEELGIDFKDINIIAADTDVTPLDWGSYSRRGTLYAGNAVKAAAADAKRQILEGAAQKLEANVDDLEIKNGNIYVKGSPEKGISFKEAILSSQSLKKGESISGKGSYNPDIAPPDVFTGKGNMSPAYSFGAAVAEVKVDEETGEVKVLKVTSSHDCGFAINPMAIEGQMDGSVVTSIGQAMLEELVRDGCQTINPSFLNYKIPTALEMPDVENIIVEAADPNGPFGAKEAGEGTNQSPAPAIANAIYNATGVRIKDLLITPEKILRGLERKGV
jgi:4-hydroxybenzoyl-CoA reductase subunit alpha